MPTRSRGFAELAVNDERSPLFGAGNAGVVATNGRLVRRDDQTRGESYEDILARAGRTSIEGKGRGVSDPAVQEHYATHAHGAVFAEVKVDPDLGQMRVSRLVGAFAAGRIINPRMVRSQYLGGMIWGVSFALHERAVMDRRSGRTMNANLAEYHAPVNADVPRSRQFSSKSTTRTSILWELRASARSASPARRVPSRMPSGTRAGAGGASAGGG